VNHSAIAPTADSRANAARLRGTALGLLLLVFAVINLATLPRVPFVWLDEIYFADPAINLIRGEGFISRVWDNSPETRMVASTSPVYSLVLAGWLKMFGADLLAVRSLGVFLTAAGMLVFWSACTRWKILASRGWIIGASCTMLCAYSFAFSYRSGRPEPLVFLTWTFLFHVASWKSSMRRNAVAFFVSLLTPFIGQIVCIALGILAGVLFLIGPRRWVTFSAAIIGGLAAGTLCFVGLYQNLGIWTDFQVAVNKQGGNPLHRLVHRLTSNPLAEHRNTIPKDFSLVPLLIGLGWMSWRAWRDRALRWGSLLCFTLLYASLVPFTLYLVGKFPTYYAWMLTLPLAVAFCTLCAREETRLHRRLWGARALLVIGCLVGLPAQLAAASADWGDRDYARVEEWAQHVLRADDVALVDYPFYYAARKHAAKVYVYGYAELLRPEDIAALTVVILSPHLSYGMKREDFSQKLGPEWTPAPGRRVRRSLFGNDWQLGYLSLPNYDADVLRRLPSR
jgi:hypothetical protein